MTQQVQPIFILPEGATRTTGRSAQKLNIEAGKLVAETVRTTLGPKGMDKMLVDSLGDIVVTNDGVTILEEMNIENPAAKMIVEVAKTQEEEVGDGTTTAVVIAGELLNKSSDLLEKNIHPTIIAKGFRIGADKAVEFLNEMAEEVDVKDTATLNKIAITAMTGKGAEASKEHLGKLAVNAVQSVVTEKEGKSMINLDDVKIEKKAGGSVEESELIKGVVIDKEKVNPGMPKLVKEARIALIESALEIKSTETDAKIQITEPSQLQAFLDQEEEMLKKMVDTIVASGANVVFCQKGIDDMAQHFLAKNNIFAARRVKKSDMEKLSRATGATIITNLEDLSKNDLGYAGMVEEKKVGDEEMTFVRECKNPKAVTLLVRGGTEHVVDEVKRALDDALGDIAAAVRTGKVIGGAGSTEVELSRRIKLYSDKLSGREQLAVYAFAEALESIPRTLAENAGLDPIDVMTELKAAHDKNNKWAGIDVFRGEVFNSWEKGIIEPLKIKTQAVSSATEAAVMILRIDDVIAAGAKDSGNQMPQGMGGGMPEM